MAIVTFTTDFGFADGYVGAMKGVVLSLAPEATLVDITHAIPPQDVAAGAVALAQAAPLFPRGTIHVAVVDPGVGGARADLVVADAAASVRRAGQRRPLAGRARAAPGRSGSRRRPSAREPVSPTFHGRDVFAPAAGPPGRRARAPPTRVHRCRRWSSWTCRRSASWAVGSTAPSSTSTPTATW